LHSRDELDDLDPWFVAMQTFLFRVHLLDEKPDAIQCALIGNPTKKEPVACDLVVEMLAGCTHNRNSALARCGAEGIAVYFFDYETAD